MNHQKSEKRSNSDCVEIVSIWRTIQGEGPFAGMPAVFIRMAGCNLQCQLCDTDYTSDRQRYQPREILEMIEPRTKLVVITGGEPYRQASLVDLVDALLRERQLVDIQIETNGTLFLSGLERPRVTVVCSPKTPSIHSQIFPSAYKYVVEKGKIDPADGLPTKTLGNMGPPARPKKDIPVYIQPLDDGENNEENLKAAVDVCLRFGYRLSVQIHKLAGLQ